MTEHPCATLVVELGPCPFNSLKYTLPCGLSYKTYLTLSSRRRTRFGQRNFLRQLKQVEYNFSQSIFWKSPPFRGATFNMYLPIPPLIFELKRREWKTSCKSLKVRQHKKILLKELFIADTIGWMSTAFKFSVICAKQWHPIAAYLSLSLNQKILTVVSLFLY